jgi:hypothetical protein
VLCALCTSYVLFLKASIGLCRIWRRILGVWVSDRQLAYYEQLINHVRRWDLVTDDLYRLEVQDTSDHSAYFVFEVTMDLERDYSFPRD